MEEECLSIGLWAQPDEGYLKNLMVSRREGLNTAQVRGSISPKLLSTGVEITHEQTLESDETKKFGGWTVVNTKDSHYITLIARLTLRDTITFPPQINLTLNNLQ